MLRYPRTKNWQPWIYHLEIVCSIPITCITIEARSHWKRLKPSFILSDWLLEGFHINFSINISHHNLLVFSPFIYLIFTSTYRVKGFALFHCWITSRIQLRLIAIIIITSFKMIYQKSMLLLWKLIVPSTLNVNFIVRILCTMLNSTNAKLILIVIFFIFRIKMIWLTLDKRIFSFNNFLLSFLVIKYLDMVQISVNIPPALTI